MIEFIAIITLIIVPVGLYLVYNMGKDKVKLDNLEESKTIRKKRHEIDKKLNAMSDDELREFVRSKKSKSM